MAAIYELGLEYLQLSPGAGATPDEQQRFETGLVDLMRRQQLYFEKPDGVEITGGVLYRARINIPARVPVGNYTRSEEHTSELQSLIRTSYAVFCLKKKQKNNVEANIIHK